MERFRPIFWQVLGLSLAINLVALGVPLFTMLIYDRVIGSHSTEALLALSVGALLALLFEILLRTMRGRCVAWFAARMSAIIDHEMIAHLLRQPLALGERVPIAQHMSRFKSFHGMRDFLIGPVFTLVVEMPFLLVLVAALGFIGGGLVLVPLVAMGLHGLILAVLWPKVRLASFRGARIHAERQHMLVEGFSKLAALHEAGIESSWKKRFAVLSRQSADADYRSALLFAAAEHMAYAVTVLSGVALLAFGVHGVWNDALSAGALVGVMILGWRILHPMQHACAMLPHLQYLLGSMEQINSFMRLPAETSADVPHHAPTPLMGDVTLTGVALRYSRAGDPVLLGLTASSRPGEIVAITGGNGSGKSSVLKLLAGLYPVTAGSVRIDGTDIRQMPPELLRRRVTYLAQRPEFFPGTIRENLLALRPDATPAMLREALERADAWQSLQRLPGELDASIGGEEGHFPTGLLFRLNLARAYLRDRPLMLLDEMPLLVLGGVAGDRFRDFLTEQRGKRTVWFVTHRSDYLRLADRVLLLRGEHRATFGTPDVIIPLMEEAA